MRPTLRPLISLLALVAALAPFACEARRVVPPSFDGVDSTRARIEVALELLAEGFRQPTDLQFAPGHPDLLFVLEKTGTARWLDLKDGARGVLLEVPVLTSSEQGLLGLAFHPRFDETGRLFTHTSEAAGDKRVGRVRAWRLPPGADPRRARPEPGPVLFEVEQPYVNHDAGQLAFGPDGYLYVGWGDGGAANDPHGHGQNLRTFLGTMSRVDVDGAEPGRPYRIPPDNPFVGRADALPETWAYGLRNPWRFAFAPDGRLVVADVGQDRWEEVDILVRGGNYGWNEREGRHCFPPSRTRCPAAREGMIDPVYEYPRTEGTSITGGYVYRGARIGALKGRYVFGDFGSGRIWAIDLPAEHTGVSEKVHALGRWQISPATFGLQPDGEVLVADFGSGAIYRLVPAK